MHRYRWPALVFAAAALAGGCAGDGSDAVAPSESEPTPPPIADAPGVPGTDNEGVSNSLTFDASTEGPNSWKRGAWLDPESVKLAPGDTVRFRLLAVRPQGDTVVVPGRLVASGGTMGRQGFFRAGSSPGSYRLTARIWQTEVYVDTATITVEPRRPGTPAPAPAPYVTALEITPVSSTVEAGKSIQLAAKTTWSDGQTRTTNPVEWSATGGVVDPTGNYAAGQTAGAYKVWARSLSGAADTVAVTVTVPGNASPAPTGPAPAPTQPAPAPTQPAPTPAPSQPAPPPSGSGAGAGPNQPAGYRQVFDNPLSSLMPSNPGLDAYGFKYYGSQPNLAFEDGVVRVKYPAAFGGIFSRGSAPATFVAGSNFPANAGNFYCKVRFRPSRNWTNGAGGGQGIKFFFFRSNSVQLNHYFGLDDSNSRTNRLEPMVGLQSSWMTQSWRSHYNINDGQGSWSDLEFLVEANTPGQRNGVSKIWVNGQLRMDARDLMYFAAGQTPRWDYLWVDPTYGGNPPGQDIHFDLDNWYCSLR